jgi:hypothetical protein
MSGRSAPINAVAILSVFPLQSAPLFSGEDSFAWVEKDWGAEDGIADGFARE